MGQPFRKINASIAGGFGSYGDKIKQWVEVNGGKFSKQLNSNVTHLITTESAFKKSTPEVRAARRIKDVKIVSVEWLEDSLLSKTRRPKREGPYLWVRKKKDAKKKKASLKAAAGGKQSGNLSSSRKPLSTPTLPPELGKTFTIPIEQYQTVHATLTSNAADTYHVYTDQRGHRYSAFLIRPTSVPKYKERHVLKIYESNSTPRTYAVFVKYTRVGRMASDFLTAPGDTLAAAMRSFNKFIKAKAGRNWSQRDATKVGQGVEDVRELVPAEQGWFEYMPDKGSNGCGAGAGAGAGDQYDDAAIAATGAMLLEAIGE